MPGYQAIAVSTPPWAVQSAQVFAYELRPLAEGGGSIKTLLFVRHGETEWNAEGRLQGQEDIALSAEGRRQVALSAPLVARLHPDYVVCSDLRRTYETSWLLEHPAPELEPRLREANLGDWTGLRSADLRATASEQYRDWRAGRYTPPNGETWAALCARVDAVL